jgi:type II secretory pathway predicted ATPase ExeA/tetratricopeptide (TPR) repeat protein
MYRSHYNLAKKPFQLTTDPKFLWLGEKHKEALATLKYGVIDQKGFLLVTGDVGTGKTTLINALLESIEEDTLVANIRDPALNLIEFFNFVALSFNIPKTFHSKIDFIVYFSRFLKKVYSENKNVLLIIDEVHRLSKEVLEHIRLLSNIELPEEKLVNIFFVGQNEIHQILALPECRALRQRISLVYRIEPLSENETLVYIKHRLKVAGTEQSIFTQDAVRDIYNFSKGYPRLINIICDHALLTGYARDLKKITPNIIMECAQQFNSLGETWNNNHSISHNQHHPECRSHSVTCPFLNDITEKATRSENTGTRIFILPRPESAHEQISSQRETQHNIADDSQMSDAGHLRKRNFSWSPVLSFLTRMQKGLFSITSAAVPLIERTQKRLFSVVSAAVFFLKRIQKKLFSLTSAALPFVKRTQEKLLSRVAATSLPTLFQKKRFLRTVVVSVVLMILIIAGLYLKALTTKDNSTEPTSLALKKLPSSQNNPEDHLTLHASQIKVDEITTDHQIKAISHQKTNISKPNILEQAKTALHNNNFNRAIELFEQVMAQNPANAPVIKTYYSKALQGQADIVFIKNPDTAEMLLSKAIGADSENAKAHFDLGRLYTKSKNYPKAIKAYQRAANLNHRPSDAFYNLGFIYASIKNFTNAEKMFFHVVDLKPPYLDKALFNLAVVQQKQGKKQECIENLEKALISNPKNQRARQYLNQLKNDKELL